LVKDWKVFVNYGEFRKDYSNFSRRLESRYLVTYAGKTSFIKLLKGDFDLESKPTRLIDYFITKKQGV
jgi:hypothetical protein